MTELERQKLKIEYSLMAGYYRQQISDQVILMYVADLRDLPYERVMDAFDQWRKEPRHFAPLPAEIREKIYPRISHRAQADEVANLILAALYRHGYTWPIGFWIPQQGTRFEVFAKGETSYVASFEQALLTEVGEIGVQVMRRMGGYTSVCREWGSGETSSTTFRAQLRDLAASVIEQEHKSAPLVAVKEIESKPRRSDLEPPGGFRGTK